MRYVGTEVKDNSLNIFTEWVSGGSLEKMLKEYGRLPPKVVAWYTRQILLGLVYLHSNKVVHRDIKVLLSVRLSQHLGPSPLLPFPTPACPALITRLSWPFRCANVLRLRGAVLRDLFLCGSAGSFTG